MHSKHLCLLSALIQIKAHTTLPRAGCRCDVRFLIYCSTLKHIAIVELCPQKKEQKIVIVKKIFVVLKMHIAVNFMFRYGSSHSSSANSTFFQVRI